MRLSNVCIVSASVPPVSAHFSSCQVATFLNKGFEHKFCQFQLLSGEFAFCHTRINGMVLNYNKDRISMQIFYIFVDKSVTLVAVHLNTAILNSACSFN